MKKILVVDDEYVMANLIKLELSSRGYQIEIALSGQEAFDKMSDFIPDIITMDIMMPDMNGFQVFEMLQADERYKKIPVIFVSAVTTDLQRKRVKDIGGVDALPKPVNFVRLINLIESCEDGFVRLKN